MYLNVSAGAAEISIEADSESGIRKECSIVADYLSMHCPDQVLCIRGNGGERVIPCDVDRRVSRACEAAAELFTQEGSS